MKRFSKGFTLIELLVVIAIIGILSSVVLASLSTARSKGSDARVQSQLQAMRAQAELYVGTGTAFPAAAGTVCPVAGTNLFFDVAGTNSLSNLFNGLSSGATNGAAAGRCASAAGQPSTGAAWAVAYPLSSGAWCVDSTGISRGTTAAGAAYASAAAAIANGAVVCS